MVYFDGVRLIWVRFQCADGVFPCVLLGATGFGFLFGALYFIVLEVNVWMFEWAFRYFYSSTCSPHPSKVWGNLLLRVFLSGRKTRSVQHLDVFAIRRGGWGAERGTVNTRIIPFCHFPTWGGPRGPPPPSIPPHP